MPKNSASARPRSRSAKVCTAMASAAGNMIAPPTPCTTRNATIHASAALPLGVSPHSADAPANTITPSVTIFRWPCGVGQPPAEGEQRGQRYQVGVDRPLHARAGQPEFPLDLGTAMDTIVWSMKVMATAKIIAARTRFLDRPPAVLTARALPSV